MCKTIILSVAGAVSPKLLLQKNPTALNYKMQETQIKGHYISPSPLSNAQIGISMQVQAKRHFNTNTSPSSLY